MPFAGYIAVGFTNLCSQRVWNKKKQGNICPCSFLVSGNAPQYVIVLLQNYGFFSENHDLFWTADNNDVILPIESAVKERFYQFINFREF